MIEVRADRRSYLRLREQLELIGLDKPKRQKILKKLGQYITKKTKKNIRANRDPEGKAWPGRKKGNKKMLRGFTKKLKHYQRDSNRTLYVGWPTRRGAIALAHQEGKKEQSGFNKRFKQTKKNREPKKTDPATREQAKELRAAGFRLPAQGRQRRGRKPTIKFITDNMTVGEVAKKTSELENKTPARKWDINRPKRRLIGISQKRVAMIIKREMQNLRSN
ncbi:MAG: phage virion morphogenesis protein [Psychromonas sp.]|jgi:phage virion morphogenesis protein|uniref:phage virion morphogenesis protein n=1 Tax=Psychromonas sp. TaxID=1884585 RepID=UPI0039E29C3D